MDGMSARIIKSQVRTDLIMREKVAHTLECLLCTRDSLTVTSAGVISWLSPHGKEPHANAITVLALMKWFVKFAGVNVLRDLRQVIDERLGE